MCKKNDRVTLDIIDLTKEGLGIAKLDGKVFFVKDAIVGDKTSAIITKVSKNIIYAKSLEIIEPSKDRITSKCAISDSCGGCVLLSLNYQKQLELKKNFTLSNIKKITKLDLLDKYEGIIGMEDPYHFRNKMQVPFARQKDDIVYGFYASRTHYIIPNKSCIVSFESSDTILESVKFALKKHNLTIYDETSGYGIFRQVLLRSSNKTDEISITYVVNDKKLDNEKIDFYKNFDKTVRENLSVNIVTSILNINTENNNVLLGKENILLFGHGYIEDEIGGIKYRISPQSFYQVNKVMTKKLYDKVVEYGNFSKDEVVMDLFCGVGTISLYIASHVKEVVGIEIIDAAVKNASENAKINNITNAKFITFDVNKDFAKNALEIINNQKVDCIIVDPPRKGLSIETIEIIKNLKPKKMIYVSCDSATLARDLFLLCVKDPVFEVERCCNVDMFPHTMHVETIVSLSKI